MKSLFVAVIFGLLLFCNLTRAAYPDSYIKELLRELDEEGTGMRLRRSDDSYHPSRYYTVEIIDDRNQIEKRRSWRRPYRVNDIIYF